MAAQNHTDSPPLKFHRPATAEDDVSGLKTEHDSADSRIRADAQLMAMAELIEVLRHFPTTYITELADVLKKRVPAEAREAPECAPRWLVMLRFQLLADALTPAQVAYLVNSLVRDLGPKRRQKGGAQ